MRKASKFELFYSILFLTIGAYLITTDFQKWSSPMVLSVLALQQAKNYVHFKKSDDESFNKKAKASLISAFIIGSSTLLLLVFNIQSLL